MIHILFTRSIGKDGYSGIVDLWGLEGRLVKRIISVTAKGSLARHGSLWESIIERLTPPSFGSSFIVYGLMVESATLLMNAYQHPPCAPRHPMSGIEEQNLGRIEDLTVN